jgi:hypothetical protein
MTEPEVRMMVTEYTVTALPDDADGSAHAWRVTVEYRGRGKWAVKALGQCYDRDGNGEDEGLPSGRTDEFLERFRFDDVGEALVLAAEIAPKLKINGLTAADVLARNAARD